MVKHRQFVIAREGWLPLLLVLVISAIAGRYFGWLAAAPALVAVLVTVMLFRNPHRNIPPVPQGVISPLDGTIEIAEQGSCPLMELEGYHVRIRRQRWTAPYYNRSPIEGRVRELPCGGNPDGGHAWRIETDESDNVVVLMNGDHILSHRSFRPCYGERVGQGARSGTRRLGSVADIWLPANAKLLVRSGQRVSSGQDVLAKLVHQ